MAILEFQKPDKVVMLEANATFGKFEFRPLEPGYGITIGNALRRILLSSLEGYAICSVKISGVDHEFSTIPGVIENVLEIVLNLKKIRLKKVADVEDLEKITVIVSGQEELRARDLSNFVTSFEVLNPNQLICRMEKGVKFQMDLFVTKGRGYVPAEENKIEDAEIGVMSIDSIFTPIRNVTFSVENWRVEQKTDYEKLVMEVTTDGSVSPKDALKGAAKILIHHFLLFSDDEKITEVIEEKFITDEFDEDLLQMRQLLKTKLVDLDLSVRATNCLKSAEVETLGDLVQFEKTDLLKFRNFGKKSLAEIEDKLSDLKLDFGMDTSKYKIDKE